MSEKIPISLRNSDLFLKPEFRDINRKEINIDTSKDYVLEKGPSLGENNQFRSLHTLLCEKKNQNGNRSPGMGGHTRVCRYELRSRLRSHSTGVAKAKLLAGASLACKNQVFTEQISLLEPEPRRALHVPERSSYVRMAELRSRTTKFSQTFTGTPFEQKGVTKSKLLLPLFVKHPKRSFGTVRYGKLDKDDTNFESHFAKKNKHFVLGTSLPCKNFVFARLDFHTKNKQISTQFDDKLDTNQRAISSLSSLLSRDVQLFNLFKWNSDSLFSKRVLYKSNKGFAKADFKKRSLSNQSLALVRKSLTKSQVFCSAFANLICSGISREFLFVSMNLILFSIVAVVQRSQYGKNSSLTDKKEAYRVLCESKLPNIISCSKFSTADVRQELYKIIPKQFTSVQQHRDLIKLFGDEKQKNLVGVFAENSDLNGFRRSDVKYSVENAWTPYTLKQSFGKHPFASISLYSIKKPSKSLFSFLRFKDCSPTKVSLLSECTCDGRTQLGYVEQVPGFSIQKGCSSQLVSTKANSKLFCTTDFPKLAAFREYLIQPWYCIKVCNTLNTKIIATRSLCENKVCTSQADNNLSYLLKQDLSKLDLLYNDDTIKGFQYYLPFYTSPERVFAESDTIPSKRDTVYFKKTSHSNKSYKPKWSSCTNLSEFILKRCFYRYGFLVIPPSKKVYLEARSAKLIESALSQQGIEEIKKSCVSTNKIDIALNANLEILPSYSSSVSRKHLQKSSSISFITLKRLEGSNPLSSVPVTTTLFCCKKKAFSEVLVNNPNSNSSNLPRFCLTKNVFLKGLLPVISESGFTQYLSILNRIENLSQSQKKEKIVNTMSFSLPKSSLVKEKLAEMNFSTFIKMRDAVRTSVFTPDTLIRNTSVSGYQFPELQNREISYLFRKQALFHFYYNQPENKTFFEKLFTQLTTAFRKFKSDDLISQVLSTSFLTNQSSAVISQINTRSLPEYLSYHDLKDPNCIAYQVPKLGFVTKDDGIKMQYTQVDLDDIKDIKDLFARLNRDYEEYLRQPKDSLPALIISPSLQDDLEIEDEGIRIFRKRDLIRSKKGNLEDKNIEQELDFTLGKSASISKNEMQNKESSHAYEQKAKLFVSNVQAVLSEPTHQLLVKKALRQAQEEIDNIAKKDEKGTEKDKQVIPPLTRLEALYTIRNRERRYEQAKDFGSRSVKTTSSLRRIASILSSRVLFWKRAGKASRLHKDLHSKKAKVAFQNSTKTKKVDALSETRQVAKYKSLPIFEQLFLYSDKSNDCTLNELFTLSKSNQCKPYQSFAALRKQKASAFDTKSSSIAKLWHNRIPERWIGTPWLLSKAGDETICTDRKHSFFGEMNLPPKRLSAQEQKQIFQQKANPLLKINNKKTKPTFVSPFSFILPYELLQQNQVLVNKLDKVSTFNEQVLPTKSTFGLPPSKQTFDTCHNVHPSSVLNTVPLSLLSPFSVRNRPKYKKNEVIRFACKSKAYAVPKQHFGKTSGYVQKALLFVQMQDAKAKLLHAQRRFCVRNFVFTNSGGENKVQPELRSGKLLKACLAKQSFKELDTKDVKVLPDLVGIKNRIYFYDNLSQNKACQSSAPKVKNTALQSPVSHRIWQPKRMEASTFRVSERNKKTSVLPRISQKDWKNSMEWQLRKYFVEEDKRLLPLSLNKNKDLKIKKLHFYLPWISLKKPTDLLNKQAWGFYVHQPAWWRLTRLDLTDNSNREINLQAFFSRSSTGNEIAHSTSELSKVEGQVKPKVVFRLQATGQKEEFYQNKMARSAKLIIVAQPRLNTFVLTEIQDLQNRLHLPKSSICNGYFVDSQRTNYWRLPTQQTIYTANLPVKKRSGFFTKHKFFTESTNRNLRQISNRRSTNTKVPITRSQKTLFRNGSSAITPKKGGENYKKGSNKYSPFLKTNQLLLFESVTRYSWLFIYTFVFVLMFKQLFMFVYKVGLKDFFIHFLNSEFGRTITSEEFRYSIQNSPLSDFHMPKKRLQGVFGLQRNKVQLLEIVWFLRNHCQGRNGIRGVLLVGPPGVENVSVVQAIAGEANVPIIVQSLEKIAQDSEPQRQLEQLYMRAHKQAPCVLFLDQLDLIGARRDQLFTDTRHKHNGTISKADQNWMQNKSWQQNSLNSLDSSSTDLGIQDNKLNLKKGVTPGNKLNVVLRLLTILDGITQSSGVVTVATARDITKLDPALLRPKRFDRRIYLSLPNRQDRVHLFKVETQSIGHLKEMPWDYLSLQTESMSATDIRSAINYSLFKAVLQNSVHTVETLEYGIDCVKSLTDKRVKNT